MKAGVDPNLITKHGYDQARDHRWTRWPHGMQRMIEIRPEPNYVILKDGTKVEWEIDWEGPLNAWREKERERLRRMGMR